MTHSPERIVIELNKQAMAALSQLNYTLTLYYLTKANEILPTCHNNQAKLYFITLNNQATFYKKAGKYKVALKFLHRVLDYCKQIPEELSATVSTYLSISSLISLMGDHEQALSHAIKVREIIKEQDPARLDDGLLTSLIISHHNIAVELEATGDFAKAYVEYRAGATLARAHLGPKHEMTVMLQNGVKSLQKYKRDLPQRKGKVGRSPQRGVMRIRGNQSGSRNPKREFTIKRRNRSLQRSKASDSIETTENSIQRSDANSVASNSPKKYEFPNNRRQIAAPRISSYHSTLPLNIEKKLNHPQNPLVNSIPETLQTKQAMCTIVRVWKKVIARATVRELKAERILTLYPDMVKYCPSLETDRNRTRLFLEAKKQDHERRAAVKIQSNFRRYRIQKLYKQIRNAIKYIQQYQLLFPKKNIIKKMVHIFQLLPTQMIKFFLIKNPPFHLSRNQTPSIINP